jgi:hypothetical protein
MAAPGIAISTNDTTTSASRQNNAIFLVQAITQRGKINKPIRITSGTEFYQEFGEVIHPTGELCIRALRLGAILIVNPVHHYTTISNANTIEGTKASVELFGGDLVIEAAEVGAAYNGIVVSVVNPQSRRAGYFDLVVTNPTDFTFVKEIIRDVAANFTVEDATKLNQRLKNVQLVLTAAVTLVEAIYDVLTGGAKDISTITVNDFIGAEVSRTGLHAFLDISEGFHLVNFNPTELISSALDAAYVAYGTNTIRQVHLYVKETTATKIVEYRTGTGAYSHQPIDSLFAAYWAGTVDVPSSKESLNRLIGISPMGDYVGCVASKDARGAWLSVADIDFGRLATDVLSVSSFTQGELDLIYDSDVNFVFRSSLGFKFNGNRSLYQNQTKVSSKLNVASLTIYLMRWLRELAEMYLHKPNDVITWNEFYRAALPTMSDLERRRAIEPTEGIGWLWVGDQNAKNLDDLKYNNKNDIAQGIYNMQLQVIPKSSIERINILVTKTNEIVNVQLA